ncbi:hypothetical protein J3A83DRAFT_4185687 [Scleroderma citrinum]
MSDDKTTPRRVAPGSSASWVVVGVIIFAAFVQTLLGTNDIRKDEQVAWWEIQWANLSITIVALKEVFPHGSQLFCRVKGQQSLILATKPKERKASAHPSYVSMNLLGWGCFDQLPCSLEHIGVPLGGADICPCKDIFLYHHIVMMDSPVPSMNINGHTTHLHQKLSEESDDAIFHFSPLVELYHTTMISPVYHPLHIGPSGQQHFGIPPAEAESSDLKVVVNFSLSWEWNSTCTWFLLHAVAWRPTSYQRQLKASLTIRQSSQLNTMEYAMQESWSSHPQAVLLSPNSPARVLEMQLTAYPIVIMVNMQHWQACTSHCQSGSTGSLGLVSSMVIIISYQQWECYCYLTAVALAVMVLKLWLLAAFVIKSSAAGLKLQHDDMGVMMGPPNQYGYTLDVINNAKVHYVDEAKRISCVQWKGRALQFGLSLSHTPHPP